VSTLSSANYTDRNILITKCNHIIIITDSRSARASIRQLANSQSATDPQKKWP